MSGKETHRHEFSNFVCDAGGAENVCFALHDDGEECRSRCEDELGLDLVSAKHAYHLSRIRVKVGIRVRVRVRVNPKNSYNDHSYK